MPEFGSFTGYYCIRVHSSTTHLLHFENELQSERLQKVMDYVNEVHTLCGVLGLDFGKTVSDVHPSLRESSLEHATNISDSTLEGLDQAVLRLKTERKFRLQKVSFTSNK